jgi:hypothetical protein
MSESVLLERVPYESPRPSIASSIVPATGPRRASHPASSATEPLAAGLRGVPAVSTALE